MAASKQERLLVFYDRLRKAHPFGCASSARAAVETILREVEDELSGVPENPDAATGQTDDRMYPPHDGYEMDSGIKGVRTFRHKAGHRTSFGENGSIRITKLNGETVITLKGADGRTIEDMIAENSHE